MLLRRDAGFTEVADRVWAARHTPWDVNSVLIGGSRGCVLVDTLWSVRAGRELAERARPYGNLLGVVNTHEHFDHILGNGAFDAPVIAHETAAARIPEATARIKKLFTAAEEHAEEVLASEPVTPAVTFSSTHVLDLGDRAVELVHPGRGHTAGDLVAVVPDAGVLVAGDLVEESPDRDGCPGLGADCFLFEWPQTLDLVITLLGEHTRVLPGHGDVVDRAYVSAQREALVTIAETVRTAAGNGVGVEQMLAEADWPYPRELIGEGVRRAYDQLPPEAKRLPLL